MARHGKKNSKNFGYGNSLEYATKNSLRMHYGDGHFQTVNTHLDRARLFYDWLHNEHKITDARKITNAIFLDYVLHVKTLYNEEDIGISTAANRISSVNVCLESMREDRHVRVNRITKALGAERDHARKSSPDGMDIQQVKLLRDELISARFNRAAAIVWLARTTGMRLRECILADLPRVQREAKKYNKINIQDGCKGGRSGAFAPRWISVTDDIISALDYARQVSPEGSHNLLASDESYVQFLRREVNAARPLMKLKGIKGLHELRAAFACDRYMALVGIPAPLLPRQGVTSKDLIEATQSARQIISRELGHERIEITNAYVGSERKQV